MLINVLAILVSRNASTYRTYIDVGAEADPMFIAPGGIEDFNEACQLLGKARPQRASSS